MTPSEPTTIVMVAQTHEDDFAAFIAIEDRFLSLFDRHGLALRHRYRDVTTHTEIQVVDMPDRHCLDTYLVDPDRVALLEDLGRLRLDQRVVFVDDHAPAEAVTTDDVSRP